MTIVLMQLRLITGRPAGSFAGAGAKGGSQHC